MATNRIKRLALWTLSGSLLVLSLAGCARRQPPPETYANPAAVAPAPSNSRRFVVTETQEHYYVDSRGAMHRIVREVMQPPGGGGIFYYVENDPQPYYIDEAQRLYHRDPSGNIYYIEDMTPIQAAGPREMAPPSSPPVYLAPSGPVYMAPTGPGYITPVVPGYMTPAAPTYLAPTYMAPTYPSESCTSQWQRCMDACQGLSRREAYTRPECVNNCNVIRSNCH